ncbi:MAG: FtsX-like permease family protein [Bacteroidales bacterium]
MSHLQTAFRNILRKRSDSWINILGLALGLAITLLIWMHVLYEKSYDRFFGDHHQVFRVQNSLAISSEEPVTLPTTMYYFAERALEQHPEIEQMTRLHALFVDPSLRLEEKSIHVPLIAAVDSSFFNVLPMKFIEGNPATALTQARAVVITQSVAKRLFETPVSGMHKSIQINDINYTISGIIEDVPENSHLAFDGLVSMGNIHEGVKTSGFGFYSYLKLTPQANITDLEQRLSILSEELVLANPYFHGERMPVDTRLINIADIHLTSNLMWEIKDNGSLRNVRIFSIMSVFILMLALINYMNMATARSSLRAKEIGLRKVAGASRASLIRQFLMESFIITFFAFLLALLLAENLTAFFTGRLGVDIHPEVLFTPAGILVLLALFIITGFMAGLYPAFYLSSFNPVTILKGEMVKGRKGQFFRRALVVFQFSITIFLISSLIVIGMQLNFMLKQGLGFEKENVVIAKDISRPIRQALPEVVLRLEALEDVQVVSGANFLFGQSNIVELISETGETGKQGVTADILSVDEKFIPMMEITISEGRNFHAHSKVDAEGAFLINQAAAAALALENPLGSKLSVNGEGTVIGVVEDFQFKSLHNPSNPVVFRYSPNSFPQLYLKINPGNFLQAREQIEQTFKHFDPSWFPDLVSLNQRLESQYSSELQSANLLSAGSLLAIIISLLGVYGLAAFAIERRIREIGIRKILGASDNSLLWIFNKEFFALVIIAFIISAPLAWWAMEQWLGNFVLQIPLNVFWFFIPALITLFLSTTIITLQTWKATKENPVEAIKMI